MPDFFGNDDDGIERLEDVEPLKPIREKIIEGLGGIIVDAAIDSTQEEDHTGEGSGSQDQLGIVTGILSRVPEGPIQRFDKRDP